MTSPRFVYLSLAIATRVLTDAPLLWMFLAIHAGMRGAGGPRQASWNAVLFSAWAGLHSLLARRRPKAFVGRLVGQPHIRVAYVMISGVTLALLLLLWQPVSGEWWHARGRAAWLLTALYVGSLATLVYITSRFDYLEFLGLRQVQRSASNRPALPPVLSFDGPYGYCRHPMYLAMIAAFWVGPVMTFGRLEFVLLATVYLFVGLRFEEGNLREELGPDYDLYRRHVPMLIPRLTPWRGPRQPD